MPTYGDLFQLFMATKQEGARRNLAIPQEALQVGTQLQGLATARATEDATANEARRMLGAEGAGMGNEAAIVAQKMRAAERALGLSEDVSRANIKAKEAEATKDLRDPAVLAQLKASLGLDKQNDAQASRMDEFERKAALERELTNLRLAGAEERARMIADRPRNMPAGQVDKLVSDQSAMSMLSQLERTVAEEGATGFMPGLTSELPGPVTSLTGIGENAKKRKATVDLARQIIGKGLEEGVLRKEDEEKYRFIIPTMQDTPAIAAAKIRVLRETVAENHNLRLKGLEAARFDVRRFEQALANATPPSPLKPGAQAGAAPAAGKVLTYNPATGELE